MKSWKCILCDEVVFGTSNKCSKNHPWDSFTSVKLQAPKEVKPKKTRKVQAKIEQRELV